MRESQRACGHLSCAGFRDFQRARWCPTEALVDWWDGVTLGIAILSFLMSQAAVKGKALNTKASAAFPGRQSLVCSGVKFSRPIYCVLFSTPYTNLFSLFFPAMRYKHASTFFHLCDIFLFLTVALASFLVTHMLPTTSVPKALFLASKMIYTDLFKDSFFLNTRKY